MSLSRTVSAALDTALDRSLVLGYTALGPALRRRLPTWPADPAPDALAGREVIVTGASSGLGLATAAALVRLGAHVHCVVRDPAKLARFAAQIGPSESLTAWRCDLAELGSVREFAAAFLAAGHRLTGIVHNAGLMPATLTRDVRGRELSMVVHVLAPVLLTDLLTPALEPAARVVLVTSGGMYAQELRLDDLPYDETPYRPSVAYARSKRAQVELLGPLQERWPELGVYATHPGWAASPGLDTSLPTFATLLRPLLRTPAWGGDTTVWLVGTAEPPPGGGLWHDRRERPTSYVRATRASDAQRRELLAWVDGELGLASLS